MWRGPIPDRYYYIVRNIQIRPGSWMVPYSDVRPDIRLVANMMGGHRSLIEVDSPLFLTQNEGKLLSHRKVDKVKDILRESMDRKSPILNPSDNKERLTIKGRKVVDEEVFI